MKNSGFDLMPGEKMILHANPHWWYFWKQVVAALVVIGIFILGMWLFDGGFMQSPSTGSPLSASSS